MRRQVFHEHGAEADITGARTVSLQQLVPLPEDWQGFSRIWTRRRVLVVFFFISFALFALPAAAITKTLQVVVSISPLQALVAGVMFGVGEPKLLVPGGVSPHTYALRPSDALALSAAQVVVLIDPTFETFLSRPLATLASQARVMHVADVPGLQKYPARASWVANAPDSRGADHLGDSHAHHVHTHTHGKTFDPHLWLDPDNARHIVTAVAGVLAEVDPVHAATYQHNAQTIAQDLITLDETLHRELAPVTRHPFIVFHDAYQYLEVHYGLNAVGAATVTPERAPGIRHLSALRERIRTLGVICVFHEPQFPPKIVETIVAGTSVRVGMLDPLGSPGQYAEYAKMMKANARALRACLAPELAHDEEQNTMRSTLNQEHRQHVQSR
ncbi:Zinc ABC transporter, periplasmic-binding protein ZnuA [invertebrate metagenome]|uniref:Zinc ABC transporter, periplasmic-binding protein ZnuA n=1 Tax=invertebrate metagenome TaxID=1711999 RepID=A0A484H4P8_9ZZZZ